ncbi:MAG: CHC2 zinc finger domain-containing protein [Anaerovoracaceae bacterium]
MSIFTEVKECVTAREVAEFYGLKVGRNGLACCPFHDDKHQSMKIDKYYYCFACGAKGDVINYVGERYGLTVYESVRKIADDFHIILESDNEQDKLARAKAREKAQSMETERKRIVHIQMQFQKWCDNRINELKECVQIIESAKKYFRNKPPKLIFESKDFAVMLNSEPLANY